MSAAGFGQGTDLGTIRGTVTDSTGAVIPGAMVTVTDTLTSATRETKTNSQGNYEMFGLKPGTYKVTIAAPGMSKKETTDIVLNGSDTVSADAVLKISAAQESVVVSLETPAINTENQTISTTISNREIVELPRDSRDVYSFLYLNPNITQGVQDGEFKFLGFQSYGANFTLDGQRSTDAVFGEHTQSQPSLEAVGELNVLSNDFSGEYAGIANIRVTTKRGESQFHGSAFYNNKNSALAALQIQDKEGMSNFVPNQFVTRYPTPYFNYNDIGGSLGGPIPGGSTLDKGTLRVDHDFTAKDHVYVVYNGAGFVGASASVVAPFTGLGLTQRDRRNNTVSGSYLRTIHNNLINELRGGFNREYSLRHSNTTLGGFLSSIGFDSSDTNAYAA